MAKPTEKSGRSRSSRFKKGQSGNPRGRPRKADFEVSPSSYNVLLDRSVSVSADGFGKELGVEEALQLRTYNQALQGNRRAQRRILKMIAQREKALASRPRRHRPIELVKEHSDPDNAYEALVLLDIARPDAHWELIKPTPGDNSVRLLLEPWVVELAFGRRRRPRLTERQIAHIRRLTKNPDSLTWSVGDADA